MSSLYDEILSKAAGAGKKDDGGLTQSRVSGIITAELQIIVMLAVGAIMLARKANPKLIIPLTLFIVLAFLRETPLVFDLRRENSNAFSSMISYLVIWLGLIVTIVMVVYV